MSIWFWISIYLGITIYVYIFLRRWAKYKKYCFHDIVILIFAPILIWLYLPIAIKRRKREKKEVVK
jgi:hypothetical protein